MGVFHPNPVTFVRGGGLGVHALADGFGLHHSAHIHLVLQDAVDGGVGPVAGGGQLVIVAVALPHQPLVLAGTGDARLVELLGNADLARAIGAALKNALHHTRGHGVHRKPARCSGSFK